MPTKKRVGTKILMDLQRSEVKKILGNNTVSSFFLSQEQPLDRETPTIKTNF